MLFIGTVGTQIYWISFKNSVVSLILQENNRFEGDLGDLPMRENRGVAGGGGETMDLNGRLTL